MARGGAEVAAVAAAAGLATDLCLGSDARVFVGCSIELASSKESMNGELQPSCG
jgi:hypothetical protein